MSVWESAQVAEAEWWGDCANTYDAETLQLEMAKHMGLTVEGSTVHTVGKIVDIGGGPVSLLLKAKGYSSATVVDPGHFPMWTRDRYAAAGITVAPVAGEWFLGVQQDEPDEVWIYDTLQHVQDPKAIVQGACELSPVVRLFEWIEYPKNDCHIHTLIASDIEHWANEVGYRVSEGGVTEIFWNGEPQLGFPAVFVEAA